MELRDDMGRTGEAPLGDTLSTARSVSAPIESNQLEPPSATLSRLSDETPNRLSDKTLMALVAGDDPDAFALLYERHVRAAVALATQMCKRRAIAEEVVQEAFLSCWRSRRHFDHTRGSVKAWVLGIVRNRAIDVLRQNVAHEVTDSGDRGVEELLEARERTDREAGRREHARELLAALNVLPPEQSCVITLAYYGGYSHTEIATMLDTPIGTVKGRMRLGLRKMAGSIPRPG
jgi:RNA polymerase sigma-70 factor, ECF subfamily